MNETAVSVTRVWLSMGPLDLFRFERHVHAFPRHSHDRFTLGVFGTGNGRIRLDGSEWQAAGGAILAIGPDEVHSAEPARGRGWTYRSLYPPPELMAEAVEGDVTVLPRFECPVIDDPPLARALGQLHQRLESSRVSIEMEERLLLLLRRLAIRHGIPRRRPKRVSVKPPVSAVTRAREYIEANADRAISLADVADACQLSPFHLIRSFHRLVGIPPHAYLTQLRANRARRLLLAGEPPSSVAYCCRFSDQSHLTRTFKRIFGVTPGAYARGANGRPGGSGKPH